MEKVICTNCDRDCSTHYVMCDEALGVFCPECFPDTPCGKGQHGEDCRTDAYQSED